MLSGISNSPPQSKIERVIEPDLKEPEVVTLVEQKKLYRTGNSLTEKVNTEVPLIDVTM